MKMSQHLFAWPCAAAGLARQLLRLLAMCLSVYALLQGASAQQDAYVFLDGETAGYNVQAMQMRSLQSQAYRFESDNFIMSGQIDREAGRSLLADLETFRAAALIAMNAADEPEPRKLEIFYAANAVDFEFITDRPGAGGLYKRGLEKPVFIINGFSGWSGGDGTRRIAYHELMHHLLASYYDGDIPMWLGEGLAEYYSAYEREDDGRVTIGLAMPENTSMLTEFDWMTPRTLLEAVHEYPFRTMRRSGNGFSYVDFFYAQSWLSAHYFMSDEARAARLRRFIERWDSTMDSEIAFMKEFGLDYAGFEQALRTYNADQTFRGEAFVSPRGPGDFEMTITPLTPDELLFAQAEMARLMLDMGSEYEPLLELYDLIARSTGDNDAIKVARAQIWSGQNFYFKAQEVLEPIVRRDPENLDAKQRLAIIWLSQLMADLVPKNENLTEAQAYLKDVIRQEPENVMAHYYYAITFVMQGRKPPASVIKSVDKSVAYLTGIEYAMLRLYLTPILIEHGDYERARGMIDGALMWSTDAEDKRTARAIRRQLERMEQGY